MILLGNFILFSHGAEDAFAMKLATAFRGTTESAAPLKHNPFIRFHQALGGCSWTQHFKVLSQEGHKLKPNPGNLVMPSLKIKEGQGTQLCEDPGSPPSSFLAELFIHGISFNHRSHLKVPTITPLFIEDRTTGSYGFTRWYRQQREPTIQQAGQYKISISAGPMNCDHILTPQLCWLFTRPEWTDSPIDPNNTESGGEEQIIKYKTA